MGKSEPAKKKGTMAIAGTAAMYSTGLGSRTDNDLGQPVHEDGKDDCRGHEPQRPHSGLVGRPAQGGRGDQDDDLQSGQRERGDQVAHHDGRAPDGRDEKLAHGPLLAVDDHARGPRRRN